MVPLIRRSQFACVRGLDVMIGQQTLRLSAVDYLDVMLLNGVQIMANVALYICREHGLDYLCFRFWIGMWICLALLIMVAFDLSSLVRYITRFTEESFAMLIALIFVVEAFSKLIHILDKNPVNLRADVPLDNCSCLPPWYNYSDVNTTVLRTYYKTESPFGN
jgi:HCO3- transporter family